MTPEDLSPISPIYPISPLLPQYLHCCSHISHNRLPRHYSHCTHSTRTHPIVGSLSPHPHTLQQLTATWVASHCHSHAPPTWGACMEWCRRWWRRRMGWGGRRRSMVNKDSYLPAWEMMHSSATQLLYASAGHGCPCACSCGRRMCLAGCTQGPETMQGWTLAGALMA